MYADKKKNSLKKEIKAIQKDFEDLHQIIKDLQEQNKLFSKIFIALYEHNVGNKTSYNKRTIRKLAEAIYERIQRDKQEA